MDAVKVEYCTTHDGGDLLFCSGCVLEYGRKLATRIVVKARAEATDGRVEIGKLVEIAHKETRT